MKVKVEGQEYVLSIFRDHDETEGWIFRLPLEEKETIVYMDQNPLHITTREMLLTDTDIRKWFVPLSNWYAEQLALPIRAKQVKPNPDSVLLSEVIQLEFLTNLWDFNESVWVDRIIQSIQNVVPITTQKETVESVDEEMELLETWEGIDGEYEENPEWLNDMIRGEDTD